MLRCIMTVNSVKTKYCKSYTSYNYLSKQENFKVTFSVVGVFKLGYFTDSVTRSNLLILI